MFEEIEFGYIRLIMHLYYLLVLLIYAQAFTSMKCLSLVSIEYYTVFFHWDQLYMDLWWINWYSDICLIAPKMLTLCKGYRYRKMFYLQ